MGRTQTADSIRKTTGDVSILSESINLKKVDKIVINLDYANNNAISWFDARVRIIILKNKQSIATFIGEAKLRITNSDIGTCNGAIGFYSGKKPIYTAGINMNESVFGIQDPRFGCVDVQPSNVLSSAINKSIHREISQNGETLTVF